MVETPDPGLHFMVYFGIEKKILSVCVHELEHVLRGPGIPARASIENESPEVEVGEGEVVLGEL